MSMFDKSDMSNEQNLILQKEEQDESILEAARELIWRINQSGRSVLTDRNIGHIDIFAFKDGSLEIINIMNDWKLEGTIDNVK